MISVIIPVYRCATCLIELYLQLTKTMSELPVPYELIFINDSSPDKSLEVIKNIAKKDSLVKIIDLSRNFGQHAAITAGLTTCIGEWTVVMDCDLQDRPQEIPKLYKKALGGYDIVLARRQFRQDNFLKRNFSKLFYNLLSYLTDTQQDGSVANFGIYHRRVINAVLKMGDYVKYFPTMIKWIGFRSTAVDVQHGKRYEGKTAYSFRKLTKLALDVMFAFSDKPLRLTVKLGLLVSFLAIVFAIINMILYVRGEIEVTGWASLIISIWFLSGLIIFVLGIVGLYIGKTYEKVKDRPVFVIKETINL